MMEETAAVEPQAPASPAPSNGGAAQAGKVLELDEKGRPRAFTMTVQGGMLEALGINMYTSVGKCLAEFVANAYDSDATFCKIDLPFDKIEEGRAVIREEAKREVEEGKRVAFTILLDPLPDDITIVIKDDGHGMSAEDVQTKFLPLNRKRRGTENKHLTSESGKRHVMGRKGLGKLAGFGAAERVTIWTKRKGETYATEIFLNHSALSERDDIACYPIDFKYYEDQLVSECGTRVTLSALRCDALKAKESAIEDTLLDAFFGIQPDDFAIFINTDDPLLPKKVYYEFSYPVNLDADGCAAHDVVLEDGEKIPMRYVVKFRGRTDDPLPAGETGLRGPLVAKRRGARVYCNKRLSAGPTLFDLPTGMHNFHSQSYMECIVEADELDKYNVDLINTNRSDLRRDNDLVDTVVADITELMRKALAAHAKFRDDKADDDLNKSENASAVMSLLKVMPAKQSTATRHVLRKLAADYGSESENFKQTAPLIVNSMNAGQVLIRLMELGHNPENISVIAEQLIELRKIEKNDALKLYHGRKGGIMALKLLVERGEDEWKNDGRFEKELHGLLKRAPWLIRAEYNGYLNSNQTVATVAKSLSKELGIDDCATAPVDNARRPDLVFALQDSIEAYTVVIAELKSPNIPLDQDALGQLERYMTQVRAFLKAELQHEVRVRGFLIGSLPESRTEKPEEMVILERYASQSPDSDVQILPLGDMLRRSLTIYVDAIGALETEEKEEQDAEAEPQAEPTAPVPAPPSGIAS